MAAYTIHHVNLLYFILVVAGLAVRLFTGTSALIHYRKEKIVADGKMIDFKNAKALQIINEYVVTRESGAYNSFELNLVLDDYSRLNLMDHGDLNSLIEDAKKISKVLKVPIVSISNSLSDPYKNKMHDIKAV
ncbi:hypothetical protein LVD15_18860 [Fulvivirga maritima]|uniref:hypothetical protein n=1 Tax=Fulvivirga maritima TaxID=2904247 RepID=UPI001F3080FA|nr:hypothetical protein [Fulvivirga maritima]UII25349.1 hypothetical protein LVD15_18860 [Fulvivirga maritima]